jgi:glycosyltransferase involved in cell wall biosynthesis
MSAFTGIRMLYVGSSGDSGNGLDKRRALVSLGIELHDFDTKPYLRSPSRPLRSLAHRLNFGPVVNALNRDLLARARSLTDVTYVWVDKGQWIRPDTLRELARRLGAPLVHYANDSMLRANRSRHFRAALPIYDFLFTTKSFELDEYRRLGARFVRHVHDAVDEQRFRPRDATPAQQEKYGAAVTFIGRCEPHYARILRALAESGAGLGVWGPRWLRYARRNPWARGCVRGDGVWFDDYPVALSCAGIGLGLLSKNFPETTTTRSFEIPACGTFLLAERTADHRSLYEEGREAEYFESADELVDKVRFYIANPARREAIAKAGRERYLRSGYTRRERYHEMVAAILEG